MLLQCQSDSRPFLPLEVGPDDTLHVLDTLSRLDELIRSEYLPRAARALCNGKTSAFQAEDAGSIPAARSKSLSPTISRQSGFRGTGNLLVYLHFIRIGR